MRNKLITFVSVLCLSFVLTACGSHENKENAQGTGTPTETSTSHEHSYTSAVTKEATCGEVGETTYTCVCGDTYTEDIEKISHTESDWIVVTEVTATTDGLQHKVCTVCNEELAREVLSCENFVVVSGKLEDAPIEWKIVGTTLYVSGTGAIPDFNNFPVHGNDNNSHLLRDWQSYYEIVEKIIIEEGITKIGNVNFANFVNTKEIVFADSVVEVGIRSCMGMGLESIDFNNITKLNRQSFSVLRNMISLRIPGSIGTIPDACFNFCDNLKEIYIEEGVKAIKELAFTTESGHWNCSIHLPESITDFPSDTFNHDTTIYVKAGSKAEKLLNEFASRYNITVIAE